MIENIHCSFNSKGKEQMYLNTTADQ